jgi:hypothetical protein
LAAKEGTTTPLYYKTDTHWNHLGAALAIKAFSDQARKTMPQIHWLPDEAYVEVGMNKRPQGDLMNFLRISNASADIEPVIQASRLPIKTKQYNVDSKQLVYEGENPPVAAPINPLLVHSSGALNNKKILWLRDSFGTAMSPLMSATFSDVLQVHWRDAIKQDKKVLQLINEWKPDYVFITVVERDAKSQEFLSMRLPEIACRKPK